MQYVKAASTTAINTTAGGLEAKENNSVKVNVPQGYNAKINFRVFPVRDFQINPARLRCQPRQGASRREAEPLDLPEDLIAKFKTNNKKIIAWLAQDASNTQLFLAKPVEALLKAGVDLTRAEQKILDRNHRAVRDTHIVAPGVKVENISVSAKTSGRIGEPVRKPKNKINKRESDCGCGAEGKE